MLEGMPDISRPESRMQETREVQPDPVLDSTSYPATLWRDIKSRKSEFFVGLLLSIVSSSASVWLQYRDGMLERKHFWDGVVTTALPVLAIIVIFAFIEIYRAAASLHRDQQSRIKELNRKTTETRRSAGQRLDGNLREKIRLLCAQISQFVDLRAHTRPSYVEWDAANHDRETRELYLQRFAPQIQEILGELALSGLTNAALDKAYLLDSGSSSDIRSIGERVKELADQLPISQADQPDVYLEGTFPGTLALHARGHASEIRTGPIVMESLVIKGSTVQFGERTVNVRSQQYTIEFPVVSDLEDKEKDVVPSLLVGFGPGRSGWPVPGQSLAEFFRMAMVIREAEIGRPDIHTATEEELEAFVQQRNLPLTFDFDITYWNSEHTQHWVRHESLVYEPQRSAAFVRHAGRPELLLESTVGGGP